MFNAVPIDCGTSLVVSDITAIQEATFSKGISNTPAVPDTLDIAIEISSALVAAESPKFTNTSDALSAATSIPFTAAVIYCSASLICMLATFPNLAILCNLSFTSSSDKPCLYKPTAPSDKKSVVKFIDLAKSLYSLAKPFTSSLDWLVTIAISVNLLSNVIENSIAFLTWLMA